MCICNVGYVYIELDTKFNEKKDRLFNDHYAKLEKKISNYKTES